MTPETISVVIPTRNIAAWLPRALASIEVQEGPWHVVGVDSASTDGTREIWADFAIRQPGRVTVLDEPKARLSEAVNLGVVAAAPGLVQWIGGDDRLPPDAHSHLRAARKLHPDAGWFVGQLRFCDEIGREVRVQHPEPWNHARALRGNPLGAPAVVYDRHFAICSGLTSPLLRRSMDYDWWFRMAALAQPVLVDAVLGEFTLRHEALSGVQHSPETFHEAMRVRLMHTRWQRADLLQMTTFFAKVYGPMELKLLLRPYLVPLRDRFLR